MQVYLCCYCFFGFYIVVLAVFSYIVFKCSTVGQAFIMTIVHKTFMGGLEPGVLVGCTYRS